MDGFDEIKFLYDKLTIQTQTTENIIDRFLLNKWIGKFIITCRNQVLDESEYFSIFKNFDLYKNKIYIAPFLNEQIDIYIQKFSENTILNEEKWEYQEYKNNIKEYLGDGDGEILPVGPVGPMSASSAAPSLTASARSRARRLPDRSAPHAWP